MGYYNALEESCARLGYELVHLGLGEQWKGKNEIFIQDSI